jgi:hypothetical protein
MNYFIFKYIYIKNNSLQLYFVWMYVNWNAIIESKFLSVCNSNNSYVIHKIGELLVRLLFTYAVRQYLQGASVACWFLTVTAVSLIPDRIFFHVRKLSSQQMKSCFNYNFNFCWYNLNHEKEEKKTILTKLHIWFCFVLFSDFPLFYTGLSVWDLAWCPTSLTCTDGQFLAVTGKTDHAQIFLTDQRWTGPGLIQIWFTGIQNNKL